MTSITRSHKKSFAHNNSKEKRWTLTVKTHSNGMNFHLHDFLPCHLSSSICIISTYSIFLDIHQVFFLTFFTGLLFPVCYQLFQSHHLFGWNMFAGIIHYCSHSWCISAVGQSRKNLMLYRTLYMQIVMCVYMENSWLTEENCMSRPNLIRLETH